MISLVNGNTFRISLRDKSVHCIPFSPPYYGLRLYPIPPLVFGGEYGCDHEWGSSFVVNQRGAVGQKSTLGGGLQAGGEGRLQSVSQGQFCIKCGAWRGHFGNEPLHDCKAWARGDPPCSSCYVCHSRMYATECWRILRDDGVMFVNLGDSYASAWGSGRRNVIGNPSRTARNDTVTGTGLKEKDLMGIPWLVALALQSDGWYLRQDVIWAKSCSGVYTGGSTMPESVKDRCVKAHEYVFLLAKSQRYYFDHIAIQEEQKQSSLDRHNYGWSGNQERGYVSGEQNHLRNYIGSDSARRTTSRNRRDVWTVNPQPYSGAHYATWPPALVEPMIKAGTSERGCCPTCGAPWERVVVIHGQLSGRERNRGGRIDGYSLPAQWKNGENPTTSNTIGWLPSCSCYGGTEIPALPEMPEDAVGPEMCEVCGGEGEITYSGLGDGMVVPCSACAGKGMISKPNKVWTRWQKEYAKVEEKRIALISEYEDKPVKKAVVLDPFVGSGTTLIVARELGRSGIGIDLSQQYLIENAKSRLELDRLNEWENGVKVTESDLSGLPLFS